MLSKKFVHYLEDNIGQKIKSHHTVAGGDISLAYRLQTEKESFFLKVNSNSSALDMFEVEEIGLNTISASETIKAPKLHLSGTLDNYAFLLMTWIETKSPTSQDMELFGRQLAQMHSSIRDNFGFQIDNYIGSLPQSNNQHDNWLDFYLEERLQPQLELSIKKGLLQQTEVPLLVKMKEACCAMFQNVQPSLLHGDLWSGNYVIATNGVPYLIDPAVYYGHSEVDIAMTKLFGGFSKSFYNAYHKIIPKDEFTDNRIELYQLFYLLIHLNLFGGSYYSSVKHILSKYFSK